MANLKAWLTRSRATAPTSANHAGRRDSQKAPSDRSAVE